MRYRSGGSGPRSAAVSQHYMVVFTVLMSLLIGVVLVRLGMYGRQRWLVFWGGTLVIAALAYLAAVWLGFA